MEPRAGIKNRMDETDGRGSRVKFF